MRYQAIKTPQDAGVLVPACKPSHSVASLFVTCTSKMKTKRERMLEYADPILTELRFQAQQERAAVDDDTPSTPSPLDSAQARRAAALEVA